MKKIIPILVIFFIGILLCSCSQSMQIKDFKVSGISELLEKNNIKPEECYISDKFSSTVIKFDIKTKQVIYMILGFVVYEKDSRKYESFTLKYNDNKLRLKNDGFAEAKLYAKMTDFLNSIADNDFAMFLDPLNKEKSKNIVISADAYYQNTDNGLDLSVSKGMTKYLYQDGIFKKIEQLEKGYPNCMGCL